MFDKASIMFRKISSKKGFFFSLEQDLMIGLVPTMIEAQTDQEIAKS